MQFSEWFSIVEQSVTCVAPHEKIHVEEPIRFPDGGMLFKKPLYIAAHAVSVKQAAVHAFEADHPEDFYQFSVGIASQLSTVTPEKVFRNTEREGKYSTHWPASTRIEAEWRDCCSRYDRLLSRQGFNPVVVAADIEQMVIYEKGPFVACNTWAGKLIAGAILKQNGFAPPKIVSKAAHDASLKEFKSWVTYYESLVQPFAR